MQVSHSISRAFLAALILSFTLPSRAEDSQLQKHQKRVEELTSYQQNVCEHRSSEGEYFTCYQKLLRDFEIELELLTVDAQSQIPRNQQASFKRAHESWVRYYKTEKAHRQSMKAVQGSVHSIGYLTDLVDLVKARCNILIRQMA